MIWLQKAWHESLVFWHFVEICAHLALLIRLLCNRNHCMKCYSKRETVMDGSLFFTVLIFFDFPWRTIKLSAVNWSGISKITHFKIHRTFNRNSGGTGFRGRRPFRISIENPMYFEMCDFRNSTKVLRTQLDRSRREINFVQNRLKSASPSTCSLLFLWRESL